MLVCFTHSVLDFICQKNCHNGGSLIERNCTCQCDAGFTGPECKMNIKNCSSNPCKSGGTCNDGIDMYTCMCAEDFEGENCTDYTGRCMDNYLIGKLASTHVMLSSIPVCEQIKEFSGCL